MIYVDDMRAPYGRLIMCHMIADSDDELHYMVAKIGVQRKWFQGDHYDIALSKRALAIENGAIPITMRQCAAMVARKRKTGSLGHPDAALEWFFQQRRK